LHPFSQKVDWREQFIIPFGGLKLGKHQFDLKVEDSFFDHFEYGEIKSGSVNIHLDLEKQERMLVLDFTINGTVFFPCDRCGDPLGIDITGKERLIVKLGNEYLEESEEVQIIPETDKSFDVSTFLYEVMHLLLPAKRVHTDNLKGESQCNPEVLKKLKELSEQHSPDPRWEILGKLKNDSK